MENYTKKDVFQKLCLIQNIALNLKDKIGEINPKLDIALKCELEKAELLGLLKESKNKKPENIVIKVVGLDK